MQNAPTKCANKPDAEVGINFVIINQEKKGRESNAIDPTRHFKNSTQLFIQAFSKMFLITIIIMVFYEYYYYLYSVKIIPFPALFT